MVHMQMNAFKLLVLVAALSSCLLHPASPQEVDAATWGKPHKPPKNCPAEQPFDPKTFNWGSIYTAYPGEFSSKLRARKALVAYL
jgi:hypothetical protein